MKEDLFSHFSAQQVPGDIALFESKPSYKSCKTFAAFRENKTKPQPT